MDTKPSHSSRRFRSIGIVALALLGVFAVVATACGKSSSSEGSSGTVKAAWIYVGPINDGGWTQTHNAGREYVATTLGSKILHCGYAQEQDEQEAKKSTHRF
jgi:basic membrane lipoprotein Med (substrate-binding protein (PBP1-ABC) superfamily)